MTAPTKMALVPVEATAENGMKAALIGEVWTTFKRMDEFGDEVVTEFAVPWTAIKEIHRKIVEASPSSGRLTAADLERAAEAWHRTACEQHGMDPSECPLRPVDMTALTGRMRAAFAAIGLPVEGEQG